RSCEWFWLRPLVYEGVMKWMGGREKTEDFFRMFPIPGVHHCAGGPGLTDFGALTALENWVEKGQPPTVLIAHRLANGAPERAPRSLAPAIPVRRLSPLHDFFSVEPDRDGVVLHHDVLGKPLIVLRDSLDLVYTDVLNMIKAAALDGIPQVRIVHLYFEAFAR